MIDSKLPVVMPGVPKQLHIEIERIVKMGFSIDKAEAFLLRVNQWTTNELIPSIDKAIHNLEEALDKK